MKYTLLLIAAILFLGIQSYAQNVAINNDGSEPDPSAALDVKASDKGVLIPRVDFSNLPVSPATGLLVYVTANGPDGDNAFYYYNGTQWQKLSGAAGLENFTESNYTYDAKTGVKFLATNAANNVDFVIAPKGTGAILARQPDGTEAGGNNRGNKAVDLQMYSLHADEVASGSYSSIGGGYWNKASGSASSVTGGSYNIASNYFSTAVGGQYNTASGEYSLAGGKDNTAQSYAETVFGLNATVGSGNQIAFVNTDRLFVVGNGINFNSRSNALTILKNANTTIGGSLTLNGNGTNTSITFPTTRGTSGQVLASDGSGGISWASPSAGTITGVSGTAPIVSTGGTSPVISIDAATTSAAGSMSAADKTKLDGLTGSQWTTSGANIYYNSGNVGLGTTTPNSKLTFDNSHDSGFDEWSDYKILLYTDATPQQSYGIGIKANTLAFNSDRDYDFDQDGSTVMTIQEGKVGIGTESPYALLDLGNAVSNRKILLYSTANNDHQFTGLGLNADALRFQLANTSGNFKFYGATSTTASTELFRIQGNGQIMIPALSTAGVLLNSNTGLVSSTVGTSGQVLTTNGSGGITWTTPSSGTVSSVSGTAPISVATGTTTPVISIAAATTSAAGSMSAADKAKLDAITGTNTGNQTITLTGDVTGSGTGSFAATISSAAVTNAKMATMSANTMKANITAASASPSDLSITANTFPARSSSGNIAAKPVTDFALSMLDDANAAAVRTTIGAGTGNGTVTTVSGTAPIAVATGTTTPVISIAAATTSAAGSMSAADKTKLDGLTGSQWTTSGSNIYYNTGNVGIGTATTNAQLQLGNTTANRKIILWQNTNDDHQFYGFGVNSHTLRYQIPGTTDSHVFYTGTTTPTSTELFRVKGNGQIIIPALTTAGVLLNSSTGLVSSSVGTSGQVLTTNGSGAITWETPSSGTVSSVSGTAPIAVATGTSTPVISIAPATISTAGSMSAADKTKLDAQTTGTSAGQMQYWNGTAWVTVAAGQNGQVLKFRDGVPTWENDNIINLSVGDSYQGGIIAYFLQSGDIGYDPDVLHGIIAAPEDQSTGIEWGCSGTPITIVKDKKSIGYGEINTNNICALCSTTNIAARLCRDLTLNGYDDWFLPSADEMKQIALNKDYFPGLVADGTYWTSTEYIDDEAYMTKIDTPNTYFGATKSSNRRVRAIRYF